VAPLVSVIVTIYNGADYIASALTSILSQCYDPLEIIIVNDGSTDCTAQLAEEWIGKNPEQIKLIHRPNGGVAAARNTGLKAARGDIIGILDVDDLWPAGTLRAFTDVLIHHPKASVVQGYIRRIWLADAPGKPKFERDFVPYLAMNVGSMFYLRSVFDTIGFFDEQPAQNEDTDLHLRIREAGLQIIVLERIALIYRMHSHNLTHGIDLKKADFFKVLHNSLERRRLKGQCQSSEGLYFFNDVQRDWPVLSVVIPLEEQAEFSSLNAALQKTLNSIAAQKYPAIEIILVHSSANIPSSIDLFAGDSDAPIRFLEIAEWDYLEALNSGARSAGGDLLAWSQSGDIWSSHRIRMQLGYLLPGKTDESVTGLIHFIVDPTKSYPADLLEHIEGHSYQDILSTMMISRPVFLASGGFKKVLNLSPLAAITEWFMRLKEAGIHVRQVPYYILSKPLDKNPALSSRLTTGELLHLLYSVIERKRRDD
jgi:glycosyltransferase involved in cell wall biosynthesis